MSNLEITKNPFPQMPSALAEFALEQLFKSMRNSFKFDASSETPDP
jgi:hypothetical protein